MDTGMLPFFCSSACSCSVDCTRVSLTFSRRSPTFRVPLPSRDTTSAPSANSLMPTALPSGIRVRSPSTAHAGEIRESASRQEHRRENHRFFRVSYKMITLSRQNACRVLPDLSPVTALFFAEIVPSCPLKTGSTDNAKNGIFSSMSGMKKQIDKVLSNQYNGISYIIWTITFTCHKEAQWIFLKNATRRRWPVS